MKAKREAREQGAPSPPPKRAPRLWPENRAAWDICQFLTTQIRTTMGGAAGLDLGTPLSNALLMCDYEIDSAELPELKRKVKAFETYWVGRLNRAGKKPNV